MSYNSVAMYIALLGSAFGGYLLAHPVLSFLFRGSTERHPQAGPPKGSAKTFSRLVAETAPVYALPKADQAAAADLARCAKSLLGRIGSSVGSGIVAYVVTSVPAVAFLGAVVGAWLPSASAKARQRRMARRIRACWPDALRHLVANLQVGDSLPRAVAALGSSGPAELRPYFARFALRYSATGDFDSSVEALRSELGNVGVDQQLAALRLAHRSGGSELVAVLRTAAELASERIATERDIEARQSWTVTAARVSAAAPWVILVLLSLRPATAAVYSTALGTKVILAGAVATAVGYALMARIGKVPVK